MDKLSELLRTYKDYLPSKKCYLDGRYFNVLFSEYPGIVKDPIVFRIGTDNLLRQTSGYIRANLQDNYPDVIRLIIEVESKDGSLSRHSNVFILDPNTRAAFRFEPLDMKHEVHFKLVNRALEVFLEQEPLKGYALVNIGMHPQKSETEDCPGLGMCVAYVIKYVAMYISEYDINFSHRTNDIKKFAKAVEELYGEDLIRMYGSDSKEDIEAGAPMAATLGVGGALVGGALLGPIGAVGLGALGAAAGSTTGPKKNTVVTRDIYHY